MSSGHPANLPRGLSSIESSSLSYRAPGVGQAGSWFVDPRVLVLGEGGLVQSLSPGVSPFSLCGLEEWARQWVDEWMGWMDGRFGVFFPG